MKTIDKGNERFAKAAEASTGGKLDGETAFELWDTFGYPVDLTQLMAEKKGLTVDMEGYQKAMDGAREKSKVGN